MILLKETATTTIGSELRGLLGRGWKSSSIFAWPPDGFAVCAWILEVSGAYVRVLRNWPPQDMTPRAWQRWIKRNAADLRAVAWSSLQSKKATLPKAVRDLWNVVVERRNDKLSEISEEAGAALLELLAITDESCAGFGLPEFRSPSSRRKPNRFRGLSMLEHVQLKLEGWRTLTPRFPLTRLSVLPKQHTPHAGITLRSLTHHLALFVGGEVTSSWSVQTQQIGHQLNLLVIPWPFIIRPSQFKEATCPDVQPAEDFKCFDFEIPSLSVGPNAPEFEKWLESVFAAGEALCGPIDGVILPEAALSPEDFDALDDVAKEFGAFVVAGVGSAPAPSHDPLCIRGKNEVWMTFDVGKERKKNLVRQAKHHRWKLDKDQLEMYGLAGSLDPRKGWWENIAMRAREVQFISLQPQLTMCCLICEDLARQDPVASLVRAVGPNLVIALLSDGPQIAKRWPARYATVLADDPGSSVLTVTNLGMAQLSEPPPGEKRSRTIALWKDAFRGLKEIHLDDQSSAVVLNLWIQTRKEVSADGRDDNGMSAFPSLGGVHQVKHPPLVSL